MSDYNSTPELSEILQAKKLYESITSVDPKRSPAYLAIQHVNSVKMAELFLVGYAEQIAGEPKLSPNDSIADEWDPLTKAFARISFASGYFIKGLGNAYDQTKEILEPWNEAKKNLSRPTSTTL